MKKLYAGLAAAALAATGIACTAGAAIADPTPSWPSVLNQPAGYPQSTSTALGADGAVFTAAVLYDDQADINQVWVATTTAGGVTSGHFLTLDGGPGTTASPSAVAVTSTGTVVVSGDLGDSDGNWVSSDVWTATATAGSAIATEVPFRANYLAVSADGSHGALAESGAVVTFSLTGTTVAAVSDALPLVQDPASAEVRAVAVAADGTAYVGGDSFADGNPDGDSTGVPTLWTVTDHASAAQLSASPTSVALLGDSSVVVGEETASTAERLEFLGGTHGGSVVALPQRADMLAVSPSGTTIWAANSSGYVETVDVDALSSPIAEYEYYSLSALASDGSHLYAVAQESAGDEPGPTSLYRLGTPSAVTNAQISTDDETCVTWNEPVTSDGLDLAYLVTARDRAGAHAVTTATGWSNGDGTGQGCFDAQDGNGLNPTHAYDVTITADNGGMVGRSASAGAILPAIRGGALTVSGTPTIGNTLSAHVTGWGSGVSVTYQWFTVWSEGQRGGINPIAGQTGRTLALTSALAGKRIAVIATGHEKDHSDTDLSSSVVTVATQVTGISAKPMKAASKTLTLTVHGVTSAPGKAKVYDGKKLIGTATIKNGKLVLKLKKKLHKGKHKVTVKYAGSATVAAFTKTVNVKVK